LIDKMDHVDQEKLIVKVIDFGISTHITPDQKLTLSIGTVRNSLLIYSFIALLCCTRGNRGSI
jgi:hypothetical protein